jgi:hypothetical protein
MVYLFPCLRGTFVRHQVFSLTTNHFHREKLVKEMIYLVKD